MPVTAVGQQYSFTHYDIKDGITQSQIFGITQDKSHHLLIATRLGIGRFDGVAFTSVTKENGLPDNFILSINVDTKGRIWGSGPNSLFYIDAGKVYPNAADGSGSFVRAQTLLTDSIGNVWGLTGQILFSISNGRGRRVSITGETDNVASIVKSANGTLFAAIDGKGVFCYKNSRWVRVLRPDVLNSRGSIKQILVDESDPDNFYILTDQELFSVKGNVIRSYSNSFPPGAFNTATCICQGSRGEVWVGCDQGAYYLQADNNVIFFNERNGFTNNAVNCIFKDIDNNIWLGSNGAGLFRFNSNTFVPFNASLDLQDPNIMQMVTDHNGDLLIASAGSGLFTYNTRTIAALNIKSANPYTKRVYSLCADSDNNIWIGTIYGGLWKKKGDQISLVYPHSKRDVSHSFNDIKMDNQRNIWATTDLGCYNIRPDGSLKKILDGSCNSICIAGGDSVFVSVDDRLVLMKNKVPDYSVRPHLPKNTNILSTRYYKGHIYIGTFDYGLFVWTLKTGDIARLNNLNGLRSNSVYSIGIGTNDILWLGTGRGINKFRIGNAGALQIVPDDNIANLFAECNQNSLSFYKGQVWIGTTKGVYVLKDEPSEPVARPYTVIRDVASNVQNVTYSYQNGYKLPSQLKLPFDNSRITIGFRGINLKSPATVVYSYKLFPLETKFSSNSKNEVVDYPSLPPGKYTFLVQSSSLDGVRSKMAQFSFEVTPAYYQTGWFKMILILLMLATIFLIWKYSMLKDARKRALVEKLRLEEQAKVRRQTAEDFHDDLGNKLTRINMLSDILYKRVDSAKSDEKELISQIKENADALFTGSKHILWALEPENDQLSEVLNYLSEFGIDLFMNTAINFRSDIKVNAFSGIVLPIGYGRNITLIFKELFNNILKHSGANNVSLSAWQDSKKDLCITLDNDGKGFDEEHVKKGNGLRNIHNRAKRVNGAIRFGSNGTSVTFILKV